MSLSEYPTYELQPRHLSAAEITNPYLLIQELFSYGHLPELRELLTAWFKTTVTGSFNKKLTNSERGDIISIYEWMQKLLEAVHIIFTQKGGWESAAADTESQVLMNNAPENNLISLLQFTVQPESIFRFTAAGSSPVVFLLIVLSNKTTIPFKHAEALTELACIGNRQYTCSVIQSAELYQKLSSGHIFYNTVCTYPNRIYDNNAPALPLLPPDVIEQVKTNAILLLRQACSRAAAFSVGANSYVGKGQLAMAAFMLQQAAEQLLRAAVMILMQLEIKTHSISALLRYTACCAPQLNLPFDEPQNRQLIPLLDKAYTEARYGNFSISAAQANTLQLLIATCFHQTEEYLADMIEVFGKQPAGQ